MPLYYIFFKSNSMTRHLNCSCGVSQLKDSAPLPHCWNIGEREVLCLLGKGWLESYVLAALGRKQSIAEQQYFWDTDLE